MRRCLFLLALLVPTAALPAHAGLWTMSVHGGAVVPTADFAAPDKVDAQPGWQVGGSYDYHRTDQWTFGLDGGWSQNGLGSQGTQIDLGGGNSRTIDESRVSTWQFGAHTRYTLPASPASPLRWSAQVGGNLYGQSGRYTETLTINGVPSTQSGTLTDKRAGFRFGLGGSYWTSPKVGIDLGLDYNIAFFDRDQAAAATISYAGVHAGLTFKIPETSSLPEP